MICTICEQPIEDGQPFKRHARGDRLSPAYTHKACRKPASTVPFITTWSSEITADPLVIPRGLTGIGYAGEVASDRDDLGLLWQRRTESPGAGRALHGKVHPARQRRAMRELLCQVCGEPADSDDRGVLWLIEDAGDGYLGWPEDLLTTHPPICLDCIRSAREQCPHMWKGSAAVRVGRSDVCAVYGRRYTLGRLGPLPVEAGVISLDSPLLHWTVAGQLVRGLNDCTIVSVDEELAAHL
ncbi:hypothetical protein [Streptomyces mirabilis]|uniref:hypothetical protein n=1 Tax=Streptomyces mirabilis TaxID=68239 RepID=UPI0022557EB3|nr:hypothetical protein [Streptomyces mirabilis]MCX4607007.1 hypothetical protein [Streptomyces mirabilis]